MSFKNREEMKQADYRPIGNLCKKCQNEDTHIGELRLDALIIAACIIALTLFVWWTQ